MKLVATCSTRLSNTKPHIPSNTFARKENIVGVESRLDVSLNFPNTGSRTRKFLSESYEPAFATEKRSNEVDFIAKEAPQPDPCASCDNAQEAHAGGVTVTI
eukprot:5253050-Amphidinium_carterae.1